MATAELLEPQVIVLPVSAFPSASFGVAVSCVVPPMTALDGDGVTVTVDTGASVTSTVDVPVFVSLVAVIVVVPGARPMTTPACETVATTGLLEVHETTRPLSTLPFASFIVALSVAV